MASGELFGRVLVFIASSFTEGPFLQLINASRSVQMTKRWRAMAALLSIAISRKALGAFRRRLRSKQSPAEERRLGTNLERLGRVM